MSKGEKEQKKHAGATGGLPAKNSGYLERLFLAFQNDPSSVDPCWRSYFSYFPLDKTQALRSGAFLPKVEIPLKSLDHAETGSFQRSSSGADPRWIEALFKMWIRQRGHLTVQTDPLQDQWDQDKKIEELFNEFLSILPAESIPQEQKRDLIAWAKRSYCDAIGVEGLGLLTAPWQKWLSERIESDLEKRPLPSDQAQSLWKWLYRAQYFESFLHRKFVGQKRFSLEGHESLIPALHALIEQASSLEVEEVFLGMAHRGRLNVLAHLLSKSYDEILEEFMERRDFPKEGGGDVKYHKGFEAKKSCGDKKVHLRLCPNPSHLEAVNPVVQGMAYAKGRALGNMQKVLPVLIHGDAAFSGQGVVYESMQLMGIEGYSCGGTIHLILNNQIGFTAEPKQSRSTRYCSDLAHAFSCPVLHVNALDMVQVHRAFTWAVSLRAKFGCDVVIDLVGYRKWGHNESDEPRYTQPLMYRQIDQMTSCADRFDAVCQSLGYGFAKDSFLKEIGQEMEISFEQAQRRIEQLCQKSETPLMQEETSCEKVAAFQKSLRSVKTGSKAADLVTIAEKIWSEKSLPKDFSAHRKIAQLMKTRLQKVKEGQGLDWGCCEILAYGSILASGKGLRLSGQDSERGTFSHRHLQIVDQKTQQKHNLLSAIDRKAEVYSSPLSEFAVMGFEYGISLIRNDDLTIWEAQFGDFCNGAQVIIDQFLSSAQSKWNSPSRLVLFLPHGYEGQGPEHSSARIERFLALSSRENWSVCQLSSPSGLFHLLRRQVFSEWARPLVLFTPKGLLRHPKCVSSLESLSKQGFEEVLFHRAENTTKTPLRALILCSGRIYYDIEQHCDFPDDIALATIEQLYPLPVDLIEEFLQKHTSIQEVIWIQEEPENMGPMTWIRARLWPHLKGRVRVRDIGRERSSSTATGYLQAHECELRALIGRLQEMLYSG